MAKQTVTLNPGESQAVSFEAVPHEARTYRVAVNGLTRSFVATLPPLDGRFVIAYAWWEGLPSWRQLLASNEWPANTSIITRWKVENTGIVTTQFRVEFMGQSGSISLNPGESGDIEFIITTGDPGSYSYAASLYANGVLVDSFALQVVTTVPLLPYPALEIITWSWLPHDPPFSTQETIGMEVTIRSLSAITFQFDTPASCVYGAFSYSGKVYSIQPGETKALSMYWTNVWFRTSDMLVLQLQDENDLGEIRAPFTVI